MTSIVPSIPSIDPTDAIHRANRRPSLRPMIATESDGLLLSWASVVAALD
jgi:hypothetical protein